MWLQFPIFTVRFLPMAFPMGNTRELSAYTPIMESVPALHSASTAHSSTCEGASPGCQLSPCSPVLGTISLISASNSAFFFAPSCLPAHDADEPHPPLQRQWLGRRRFRSSAL